MIEKLLKSKWNPVIMLVAWLLLIWVRTFTGIANGDSEISVFSVLTTSALALCATLICGWNLYVWDDEIEFFYKEQNGSHKEVEVSEWEDDEEEEEFFLTGFARKTREKTIIQSPGLRKSLLVVLVLAVFCLFSFASADWGGCIDLFSDSNDMGLGWWTMNKKYIYDILILVVFPVWSTFIIRKISESRCSAGAVASGLIQILALTMMGFLLYMRLSKIWLIEMAFMNTLTLILAVRGYLWKNIHKKGNTIALLIGYALFWIMLLLMIPYNGQTFAGFMGVQNIFDLSIPGSYISNVNKILENAPFVGQSLVLLKDPYILDFMRCRNNPLLAALFYGGWCSAIALIIVEIIFVMAAAAVLTRSKRKDGRDIMLCMAWVSLAIRVVAGTLYSFGVPIPILLPFTGKVGIIADTMSMGLLIVSCMVNKSNAWFALDEEDEYEEDDE